MDRAKAGESEALQAVDEVARWLGQAMGIMSNMLNLEAIIVGGGRVGGGRFSSSTRSPRTRFDFRAPSSRPPAEDPAGRKPATMPASSAPACWRWIAARDALGGGALLDLHCRALDVRVQQNRGPWRPDAASAASTAFSASRFQGRVQDRADVRWPTIALLHAERHREVADSARSAHRAAHAAAAARAKSRAFDQGRVKPRMRLGPIIRRAPPGRRRRAPACATGDGTPPPAATPSRPCRPRSRA